LPAKGADWEAYGWNQATVLMVGRILLFPIEVDGKLLPTRMKFRHFGPNKGPEYRVSRGEYYSVDGNWLRDGVLAAIGERD
jgi:hypothetical protein